MRRRAFTLMELVVAIALMVIVVVMSGMIFRAALGSYRRAAAQTEIMRNLRLITQQLDNDFRGFYKEAPTFIGWVSQEDPADSNDSRYLDRILFFAQGGPYEVIGNTSAPTTESYEARISYMLASVNDDAPEDMNEPERVLGRTQHILTYPRTTDPTIVEPNSESGWYTWHNNILQQYDDLYSLRDWGMMDIDLLKEAIMGMMGMDRDDNTLISQYGTQVDLQDPKGSIHKILCEGVGQFRIQCWDANDNRWVPDLAYGDDNLVSSSSSSGVDYAGSLLYHPTDLNNSDQEAIMLLGNALKFTFTLYDSKGLIKDGMTFTHIVNLDRGTHGWGNTQNSSVRSR